MLNILILVKNLLIHDILTIYYSKTGLRGKLTVQVAGPDQFTINHETDLVNIPTEVSYTMDGALDAVEGCLSCSSFMSMVYVPHVLVGA